MVHLLNVKVLVKAFSKPLDPVVVFNDVTILILDLREMDNMSMNFTLIMILTSVTILSPKSWTVTLLETEHIFYIQEVIRLSLYSLFKV